ncbi:DUF2285 domain-containing protein [Xanthobacter dioxanivorans]|uniref:DUF2285 domain-containing protein n=2 Tax=Xanthobacter dioxanivorans TaxID=2528964 RepID=A0A974PTE7_9HYPH|nr:DUF2285 domain-containing protein [Xanthobacter dioxanivorans]
MEQDVLWSPIVDPAVLLFVQRPEFLSGMSSPSFDGRMALRASAEGRHAILHPADHASQLLFLPGAHAGAPLAAVIPLDADTTGRVEAFARFWRRVEERPVPSDTRITAQQRLRLRAMMLAADGRTNDASYRDVAMALYGERRVMAEPWKTSSLRDRVIGLVKGGLALIGGGYLKLLRHRRRP